MHAFFAPLRFSWRSLSRRPLLAVVAVLALGLGIGANSAIFSVVDSVLLSPLAFDDADELVQIVRYEQGRDVERTAVSYPDFLDWQRLSSSFTDVAAVQGIDSTLTGFGGAQRINGARVSPGFLAMFGYQPAQGRAFVDADAKPGGEPKVILSHQLWQQYLAKRSPLLGSTIELDGHQRTIIGVMSPEVDTSVLVGGQHRFWFPTNDEEGMWDGRGANFLRIYARLAPASTVATATADMEYVARQLEIEYPESNTGRTARVAPLKEQVIGDLRPALAVLVGAVAMVLLIACVNVANMLLARSTSRQREAAVRSALGASRSSLAWLFLADGLLLSLAGGALGLVIAFWGLDLLVSWAPDGLPRLEQVTIDRRVLAATFLLSVVSGLLAAVVPALAAAKRAPQTGLQQAGRAIAGSGGRLRSALVVTEVALGLILLIGSGLLLRSLNTLLAVDPGFDARQATVFEIELPDQRYDDDDKILDFVSRMRRELAAIPGVEAVGGVTTIPFGNNSISLTYHPVDQPRPGHGEEVAGTFHIANLGYFEAMGIAIDRGRTFVDSDGEEAGGKKVIINRSMANKLWPDQPALGQRLWVNYDSESELEEACEVIGVVADVRQQLGEPSRPTMYVPLRQWTWNFTSVVVRGPESLALDGAIRQVMTELDADLPVAPQRLSSMVAASETERRFQALLLALLAGIALVLAAAGLYGVLSYAVSQRRRELSVRLALGARRRQVIGLVLGNGMRLTVIGLAVGVVGAAALSRVLESMLYGVSATDFGTYIALSALLAAVAAVACYLPAYRASRVDPMAVLRDD